MSKLVKAMTKENNKTVTLNGAKIKKSSMNEVVDLFYAVGASRGKNITPLFEKAFAADEDLSVRVMLYARDVRQGMGERKLFRDVAKTLANKVPATAERLIAKTIELGRYDDLLHAFVGTPVEEKALDAYAAALRAGDGLAAKWAPREKSANKALASALRKHMGLSPRAYRKLLASNTKVVETQMCDKEWTDINYSHVPSMAAARYQAAFSRNDEQRYAEYRNALVRGDKGVKINASAIYPSDVYKSMAYGGNTVIAEKQWASMPNWIAEGKSFLPMIDVSGSMGCSAGGNSSLTCMDVAISLGLYCAQRQTGAFKDIYLTFSSVPTFGSVSGLSLQNAFQHIRGANWGMSTNLEAAYKLILNTAVKHKVPAEDMPDMLIIFSDMQFNKCTSGRGVSKDMRKSFKDAGYACPELVFWNLNDYGRNTPVNFDKEGVALVSGYSPALMKSILSMDTEAFTPINIVKDAVCKERYDW